MNSSTSIMCRIALAVLIWVAAGCASGSSPASVPAPSASATATTPMQLVERFRDVLKAEMTTTALAMIDELDHTSPGAEQVRQRMRRLGQEMARGAYDLAPVDQQVQGECAAVIVRESAAKGSGSSGAGEGTFAVVWLLRRPGAWKIAPEPLRYESFRRLTAAQATSFQVLDKWFQLRKAELKVESRGELGER